MKQTWTLIRFDLRSQMRERGNWLLMLACVLLALFGLLEGSRFARHDSDARAAAALQEDNARDDAKRLAARYFADSANPAFGALQWYRTPLDVRGYSFREHVGFAARPAVPGAALAIGQSDLLPAYVRVRAESMESVRTAAEIEHPARLALGRFDLLFFVVYLWPLALLALGMSVLTQERESGRVRALRLQGVSLGRLLLAQTLARAGLAWALLAGVCSAAALLCGAVPADASGALALLAWSAVLLLYTLFWAAVSVLVCALCGTRMTAAFAGFGAWLALAVVLPAALNTGAQLAAPLASRESQVQAMRDAADRVSADKLHSLARFYDSHPEWKPARTALTDVSSSVSRIQRALELERELTGVEHRQTQARQHQQDWLARAIVFSPVSLAYQSLARLAGNDGARQAQFMRQVARHQQRLRDYFQRAIQLAALGDEAKPCLVMTCIGGYGFRDFDQVPRFTPTPDLAAQPAPPWQLVALAPWSAVLCGAALWWLRRRGRGGV